MYTKYFTHNCFKREKFAHILRDQLGVCAAAVEGGVVLDIDTLNSIPESEMPKWVQLNLPFINSPLHSRLATAEEERQAQWAMGYLLMVYSDILERWFIVSGNDDYRPLIKEAREKYESRCLRCTVIRAKTGELIHCGNW